MQKKLNLLILPLTVASTRGGKFITVPHRLHLHRVVVRVSHVADDEVWNQFFLIREQWV